MSRCGVGIELDCAFKFVFGPRPIPIVIFPNQGQRDVALGQRIINLDGLRGCGFRVLPRLQRRNVSGVSHEIICIGESRIRLSVIRIFLHGLIEIITGFFESILRPFVPIKEALQIKLVGLGIFGLVPG